MRRQDYAPHPVESKASRDAKLAAVKATYPSTRFDAGDWYRVLRDDDRLFANILNDVARFTRMQLERGRLHLDECGHQITSPEGER